MRAPECARGVRMSAPGAEVGVHTPPAAEADAAAVADARAPADAVPPPETSSDARRAVAPAAGAPWRAGFHRGYAHGGYARGGADLLRALARASAYVPAPGGDSARDARIAGGAPGFATEAPRASEPDLVAVPNAPPHRTDPPGGSRNEIDGISRYGASVSHSEAWASALLSAASRSGTTASRPRKSRRGDPKIGAANPPRRETSDEALVSLRRRSKPTPNPWRADEDTRERRGRWSSTVPVARDDFDSTRLDASRALRSTKILAALARLAVADATKADAFFLADERASKDQEACCSPARTAEPRIVESGDAREEDPSFVRAVSDALETSIVVGYQGDALAADPRALERLPNAWTAAPFEPVGGRGKDVCFAVVAPSGGDAIAAAETAAEIRAQYEQMRLGTMEAVLEETRATDAEPDDTDARASDEKIVLRRNGEEAFARGVFSYEPETRGSFDDALARVARAARAATRPGSFLAYVAGSSFGGDELATYAAARAVETAEGAADVDFVVLPRNRLGRRRCTPAFARERATSAFRVAVARRATELHLVDEEKIATDPETPPSSAVSTRRATLAHGDAFGVSRKEPARLAAHAPLATVSRRRKGSSTARRVFSSSSSSATLCAYAFSDRDTHSRVTTKDGPNAAASWLVVAWTDDAGETFAIEARAVAAVDADAADARAAADGGPRPVTTTDFTELAEWLAGRTRAVTAARAAAAGDPGPEAAATKAPREADGEDSEDPRAPRAARRARAFFQTVGSDEIFVGACDVAAEEDAFLWGSRSDAQASSSSSSSVGAGVVVVEVVAARDAGNRAFAAALRAALAKGKEKASGIFSTRVLLGETRVVFETRSPRGDCLDDGARDDAPVASLRADGSVATRAIGAFRGARGRSEDERAPAIATRVAEVGVVGAGGGVEETRATDDSSRVAFAFASLARVARAARGVDRGERATVRDLVPPHVAACASLAATLRDLERIAAGRGER